MKLLGRVWSGLGHLSLVHWIVGAVLAVVSGGGAFLQDAAISAAAIWSVLGFAGGVVGWELLADTKLGRSLRLGGGPDFHVDLPSPVVVTKASFAGAQGPFHVIFLMSLRVTNEGASGSAYDWTAWGEFPDGRRVRLERLRSIEGRFAAPGYNGDVLTAEIWTGEGVGADARGQRLALYRVVNQRGEILLDRGGAAFSE